jgi:oxygen-independent coproporphyrinogen-3 oxidase
MPLSLYVHIPFCLKRCIYCDFVSGIYNPEKEDAYIKALKKEILNISYGNYPFPIPLPQGEGVRGRVFSSLYIGGGTPTVLSADALADLITYIFKRFKFAEDCEATIEANPGTVDKEKLQAIRSSGINRISIGIQSFNNKELAFLGRVHTSEEAEQAVLLARDTGFENIGIDLIYGIPNQTIDSWRKTLKKAAGLKPKHISAYELTVEKGTLLYEYLKNPPSSPFFKGGNSSLLWQRGARGDFLIKANLLDEDKIIEMYEYTIDYLTSAGYIHYEISNFAMPDYFCRHNLNYWDRGEYYGVGLGAHSFINRRRFCNTSDFEDYINTLSENKNPVEETEDITEDKALPEAIFLGLRKTRGINLKRFYESYGKDILMVYEKEIKSLQEAGLIEVNPPSPPFSKGGVGGFLGETDAYIRLTRKGLLLSNEVFIKFM